MHGNSFVIVSQMAHGDVAPAPHGTKRVISVESAPKSAVKGGQTT